MQENDNSQVEGVSILQILLIFLRLQGFRATQNKIKIKK